MELTYVFSIHVVEEAEAVGRRVGDAVRVFGGHIKKWTHEPSLVPFLSRPRCLDVHVETLKDTEDAIVGHYHGWPTGGVLHDKTTYLNMYGYNLMVKCKWVKIIYFKGDASVFILHQEDFTHLSGGRTQEPW